MWKSVAPDYEVSSDGQVRSWKSGAPKILKQGLNQHGYLFVVLCINGRKKPSLVHRLVAEAFLPNPDGKPQVNHRNGVKTDNRVENLEWCTPSENTRHAFNTGLRPQGKDSYQAKLTNEQVIYIRNNPDGLTRKELAARFSVSESAVGLIQLGKTYKQAGGKICKAKPQSSHISDDVRDEIRRLYVYGSKEFNCHTLAKKFGVCPASISKIVHERD